MSIDIINRTTYEKRQYVEEYDDLQLQKPEIRIFQKFRSELEGKRILDIGCGTGRTTAHLRNYSPYCIGIDYSSEMIKHCRAKFGGEGFEQCDVRDMSIFANNSIDFALFSFNGLGHLNHDDRIRALREIYRVLTPGGFFVFSSHNRCYLERVWHGRSPAPKLKLAIQPRRLAQNLRRYMRSYYNYKRNKRFERIEHDHSIIVGVGHDHGLVTYWLDMKSQIAQLDAIGFDTGDVYDLDGLVVSQDTEVANCAWLYYVAKKRLNA